MSAQLKMAGVKVSRASASVKNPTRQESPRRALAATVATERGARMTAKNEYFASDLTLFRRGEPPNTYVTPSAGNEYLGEICRNEESRGLDWQTFLHIVKGERRKPGY